MASMTENSSAAGTARVECPTAKDPYIRMLIVGIVMIGWGLLSGYDALVKKDNSGNRVYSLDNKPSHFLFNLGMFGLLPPAGIVALVWAQRIRRRRLVADEEGLGYVGREKIAWGRLQRLVPRGKGLLDVYYAAADGTQRRLKLDSWMLKNFNDLAKFIEAKAPNVPVGEE
jgi:hypothetical protein